MELNFDIRGNLQPYGIIEIEFDEFRKIFVDSFTEDSTRHQVFEKYMVYLEDLKKLLNHDFYQWVNGSFTSTKNDPNDIDLVTIINHEDYTKNKTDLELKFSGSKARKLYEVDAYIVPEYPENHKNYFFTKSDLVYWISLFSKTKVNKAKKQYQKGFLQIKFSANE